jgi:tetratricopeptide (TPR) repeat protein
LARYRWLHPHDAEAHLLYAEALVKDENLPQDAAVADALRHLRAIPDTASLGTRGRTQEGRLELFVLHHPSRAEGLLRRALELDADAPDPHYVLWKLKDLTGRSHQAEHEFWTVYEASPIEHRAWRLREWYMSQFYPATANPLLDRLMGIVPRQTDPSQGEALRFLRFRNAEPEAPLGYAALARWFQLEGDSRFALTTLDQAKANIPDPEQDPYFTGTLTSLLIELGELERADQCFQRWPEPRSGYEYWLTEGQVLQEVRGEYAQACAAYDRALSEWPGPIDWRTRNRKANCLARLRDQAGAARERERAKVLENLMEEKLHQRLRRALGFLEDPMQVQMVVDFYRQIDRPREAAAWEEQVARVTASKSGNAPPTNPGP